MTLRINVNRHASVENEIFQTTSKSNLPNQNPFFVGNSALSNNPILEKRKEAQEKAWKIISDAWNIDKSFDQSVTDRKQDYDKWLAQKIEAQKMISDITTQVDALNEEYGITDEISSRDFPAEYKQRYFELYKQAECFKEKILEADKHMLDNIRDIQAIAIERLKSNPMVDATNTADSIKAAANDEILRMIMQEVQENIDEKTEDAWEDAEEKAEQEELKEERLENLKEMKALQEALIAKTKEAQEQAEARAQENRAPDLPIDELIKLATTNTETAKAQKTLDTIKYNMSLLEADLKGIEIDEDL